MARKRRARVVRTSLTALISAGLIVIAGVAAGGPTAQAAAFNAGATGRTVVAAAAAASSTPCVVSINASKCQSTDPNLTVDIVNTGDTSACTFTYSMSWGDGSAAQQVTINGFPQSADYLLAKHTYHATRTQTYSVTATPVSVTGNCTNGPGSYTFTLDVGGTVPVAPSNLTVKAIDPHDIRLNWQDNSGNETGFEINNGVTSRNSGANSTTYTWGGLAPGTYMCFRIRAHNSAGNSPWDPSASPYYVCTTTPKPAPPVTNYAALGDSYSAGLGTGPAYPNGLVGCGQSVKAYPALLDAAKPALGKLHFIACAGDVTDDFYTFQLASLGFLSNVKTVTLTVGGNDIGFAPVIANCVNNTTDCYPRWQGKVNAWIAALAGKGSATTSAGRPIHAVATLLADIHREAPNARIFLAGYPRLFGTNPKEYPVIKGHGKPGVRACYLPSIVVAAPFVRYDDAQWFDKTADTLNGVLASAVATARSNGVPATFVSVRAAFTTHGDCDTGPSWLTSFNPVDLGSTSLHPNPTGQQAYEKDFLAQGI